MDKRNIRLFTLDNGLKVVLENIPHRKSVTAGIWVPVGSRFESEKEMGYSHFVEHMLFKGTKNRSYKDISREIDRLGGHMNASTSKEVTNYYVTISNKFMSTAFDILADIYFNSLFLEGEFSNEKKVILEEIKMSEDTPDDYLFDLFYTDVFGKTPMGRPIAGTLQSIGKSDRNQLYSYYTRHYGPEGSILSVAGALWKNAAEQASLQQQIENFFNQKKLQISGKPGMNKIGTAASFNSTVRHYKKDLEQVHVAFGLPGLPVSNSKDAWLHIFTHLMGGTMSSRLFRVLREENGLCYSVSTFLSQYVQEGLWGVYLGTSPKNFNKAVDLLVAELDKVLLKNDASDNEVEESKSGLAAAVELSMEYPTRRASFNAKSLMYFNQLQDWEERVKQIEKTRPDDMWQKLSELWKDHRFAFTSLGSMDEDKTLKKISKLQTRPLLA